MIRASIQHLIFLIIIVCFVIACVTSKHITEPNLFTKPAGWPDPVYDFSKNPLSQEKVELGRILFYDPILSRDSTISCASCHLSYTAFTHTDHDLSHGIEDRIGTRNSSALTNLAWSPYFMWDGAVNHLDMQALAPISHHDEMDFSINGVVERLNNNKRYNQLFSEAWLDDDITGEMFLKTISQFILTIVTANSKYDKVMRSEPGVKFSQQEERGLVLFRSKCESCHREPLFTDYSFQNNGLPVDPTLNDLGRMTVTKDPIDSLKFKVPSLRNIEYSDPYMHDGRFRKLKFVMRHYGYGMVEHKTLAPQLKGKIQLSPEDREDLIAFLLTLTDKEFLYNEDFSYPK